MAYQIALFDLDGTITDSEPVITACVNSTLRELGYPEQTAQELPRWVGPPLAVSFAEYAHVHADLIEDTIATYRRHYRQSMYDCEVFGQVRECLQQLKTAGVRLAVATSKRENYALPIIQFLDLERYFEVVAGALSDSPTYTKSTVIADALRRLDVPTQGPDRENMRIVMIGDRHHDIDGGRDNGLDTIGITWSGTDPSEFTQATAVVRTAQELVDVILAAN